MELDLNDRSAAARIRALLARSLRSVRASKRLRVTRKADGYTLVELLIAMGLALVIVGATSGLLVASLHTQSHAFNRVSAAQSLETALGAIENELRPSASVAYVGGEANLGITLTAPANVIPAGGTTPGSAVTYDCFTTVGTCGRTISGAAKQVLASNIANADVFTLECRKAEGDLVPVANGGATATCANSGAFDYVAIRLVQTVGCAGQGIAPTSCNNGTVEVDGGTSLRSQP